jgi:hypothetical protein
LPEGKEGNSPSYNSHLDFYIDPCLLPVIHFLFPQLDLFHLIVERAHSMRRGLDASLLLFPFRPRAKKSSTTSIPFLSIPAGYSVHHVCSPTTDPSPFLPASQPKRHPRRRPPNARPPTRPNRKLRGPDRPAPHLALARGEETSLRAGGGEESAGGGRWGEG